MTRTWCIADPLWYAKDSHAYDGLVKFEDNWYWKNDKEDRGDENDSLALNEAEDDEEDDEVDNDNGNWGEPHPWRLWEFDTCHYDRKHLANSWY